MRQIILTLFATLVGMSILTAAPIPKKPTVLESTHLNDTRWTYKFQNSTGFICFNKDGTYYSKHDPKSTISHCGYWYVNRNGTICLEEYYCNIGQGNKICWYFKLEMKNFPTMKGSGATSEDATVTSLVILSDPVVTEN